MADRTEALIALLSDEIVIMDGAMGTMVQAHSPSVEDFGGSSFEGCNEVLVLSRPDLVRSIHQSFLEAGAHIVETDTFGATSVVLSDYGLEERAFEINRRAAALARELCDQWSTVDSPRFAAGSMGPTTRSLSVTGGISFAELKASYRVQAAGLIKGGADLLILETAQDTRNVKAGLLGIQETMEEAGRELPIVVSATLDPSGTMLAGQTIEAFYASVMHAPLLAVGINCSTGPELIGSPLRSLSALAKTRVASYPNAGLPTPEGQYTLSPTDFAAAMGRFAKAGWLNMAGGCCGTTPDHIRALAERCQGLKPRRVPEYQRTFLSGIDFLEVEEQNRPVLVGERTNVLGSRSFKRLIEGGRVDEAAEIARRQVKAGAQVVDVCLQNTDRDELSDVTVFLEKAVKITRAPIMIDTTDPAVVERALSILQGKAVVNSVNLEDGGDRLAEVIPLLRRFGASLVVQPIDEDPEVGMALTRERKLAVCRRLFDLITRQHLFPPEDIIFDPLVFPCGSGDARFSNGARETIAAIPLLKAEFPVSKTLAGISNVSFGLPPAGRFVLNSVFLHHCTKAGLDLAIVNTETIRRYASIPEEERRLAEDLIFFRGQDPLAAFVARFRDRVVKSPVTPGIEDPGRRLSRHIVEGARTGLQEDLDAMMKAGSSPLEIINGPLMEGMAEVGRLFARNELIVTEVLQSAEVMKAAVTYLEDRMEGPGGGGKGTLLLATVKGDVHDIGKNLVEMILSNNGYRVINLGIKVPSEVIIRACREHHPDFIGLSGLLVKSAHQMVSTAEDLRSAGVTLPLMVGGAALSRRFTVSKIGPAYGAYAVYATSAMDGLAILNRLTDRGAPPPTDVAPEGPKSPEDKSVLTAASESGSPAGTVPMEDALPPPDEEEHCLDSLDPRKVFSYVNLQMLYAKHLGLRGHFRKLREADDAEALKLEEIVHHVLDEGWIRPKAIYRFYRAEAEGDALYLLVDGHRTASFPFPRQRTGERLSIADYVRPASAGGGDSVALFVATAGEGVRDRANRLKNGGEYLLCHVLQALALEMAEAAAEQVHRTIRRAWGLDEPGELSMPHLFQARYPGKRYSFGYPACPDLAGQATLFRLLAPECIGVRLTEEFMMDPEASVSALVVHHPRAKYFAV